MRGFWGCAAGITGVALALVACTDLRGADIPAETPDAEAPPPDEEPIPSPFPASDAGADAAPLPPPKEDLACADAWVVPDAKKKDPACVARQVRVIDPSAPVDPNGISIVRTSAGRLGVAYNAEAMDSAGEMRLVTFTPSAPGFAAPQVLVRKGSDYEHLGNTAKLATSGADTIHVLTHDVDDIDQSGDIKVVKLVGATTTFTNPETVFTKVKRGAETAIAVDGAGNTVATARIQTGTNKAKLSAAKQTGGAGAFALMPDITTALLPDNVPGSGQTSLFFDPGGALHLVYQHNEILSFSNPRYHTWTGTEWSYRKTLDNATLEGTSGFSPRIFTVGNRKVAAFFFRKSGQTKGSTTADLRIATWDASDDLPKIQVVDQAIPAEDATFPQYRVAMGVDGYGLVHLAIVRPDTTTGFGRIDYTREAKIGGETKWLQDIVDDDALAAGERAFVDMVVEPAGRPHIAYRSAKDGLVKYATRYDR